MEKKKQVEEESKAIHELESKIETFHQDFEELRRKRVIFIFIFIFISFDFTSQIY